MALPAELVLAVTDPIWIKGLGFLGGILLPTLESRKEALIRSELNFSFRSVLSLKNLGSLLQK